MKKFQWINATCRILFAKKSMHPYKTNLYMSEDLVVRFQSTQSKREKSTNWQNYRNEILQVSSQFDWAFQNTHSTTCFKRYIVLFTERFLAR